MDETSEGFDTASLINDKELTSFWKKLIEVDSEKIKNGADPREVLFGWAILAREQEKKANTDSLTGLFSRRAFNEFLPRITEICQKAGRPLCVLMVDADHFKKVNDEHGHEMGDEVLRAIGKVTLASVRRSDHAARYGGEENVILLPGAEAAGATFVAERLRRNIENASVNGLKVTVSIGAAEYFKGENPQDFVKRADQALYEAKNNGRNQVVFKAIEK